MAAADKSPAAFLANKDLYDLMYEGGDYCYGGEWFPSKKIDEAAVEALLEEFLAFRGEADCD